MICMLTKEGQRNYLQNGNAGQPGEEAPWAMGCTEAGGNAQTPERGVERFIPHSLWASGQPPSLVIFIISVLFPTRFVCTCLFNLLILK